MSSRAEQKPTSKLAEELAAAEAEVVSLVEADAEASRAQTRARNALSEARRKLSDLSKALAERVRLALGGGNA